MTTTTVPKFARHPYQSTGDIRASSIVPLGAIGEKSSAMLLLPLAGGICIDGPLGRGKASLIRTFLLHTHTHSDQWDTIVQTHRSQVADRQNWSNDVSTDLIVQIRKTLAVIEAREAALRAGEQHDWTNILLILEDLSLARNLSSGGLQDLTDKLSDILERGKRVGVFTLISADDALWGNQLVGLEWYMDTCISLVRDSQIGHAKITSPGLLTEPFTIMNTGATDFQTYWVGSDD